MASRASVKDEELVSTVLLTHPSYSGLRWSEEDHHHNIFDGIFPFKRLNWIWIFLYTCLFVCLLHIKKKRENEIYHSDIHINHIKFISFKIFSYRENTCIKNSKKLYVSHHNVNLT